MYPSTCLVKKKNNNNNNLLKIRKKKKTRHKHSRYFHICPSSMHEIGAVVVGWLIQKLQLLKTVVTAVSSNTYCYSLHNLFFTSSDCLDCGSYVRRVYSATLGTLSLIGLLIVLISQKSEMICSGRSTAPGNDNYYGTSLVLLSCSNMAAVNQNTKYFVNQANEPNQQKMMLTVANKASDPRSYEVTSTANLIIFFWALSCNCLSCFIYNCQDHFNLYSIPAVHSYDLYHIHIKWYINTARLHSCGFTNLRSKRN